MTTSGSVNYLQLRVWRCSALVRRLVVSAGYLVLLLQFALPGLAADFLSDALTPDEVVARLGTPQAPLVVDVRVPIEFGIGHIPGAVNIPLAEVKDRLDEFRHSNGVLVYCINGARTRSVEQVLFEHDITHVYHLEGAFNAWIQGGYPYEKGGVKKKKGW